MMTPPPAIRRAALDRRGRRQGAAGLAAWALLALGLVAVGLPRQPAAAAADLPGGSDAGPDGPGSGLPGSGLEEIVVWGRGLAQIGAAHSAAEGTVGYADLQRRPLMRVGELAEAVPGLIATQHSGGGKANQYFLRGFNLDHGTDFSVAVDGVPVNLRSHAHAQGYLDQNFLIPELVERIDYAKGVYRADTGDFSAAGSARFKTYDALPQRRVMATVGEDNYYRAVAMGSEEIDSRTTILAAGEAFFYDGPWTLDQGLERYKGFLKLTRRGARFTTRVSFQAFSSNWRGTEQIPARAVDSGLISRFGFIDDDLGGRTGRYSLTVSADSDDMELTAYAVRYRLNLFSNPTFYLDDPETGDEIEQADRRWVLGGSARKRWDAEVAGRAIGLRAGVDLRSDMAGQVALYETRDRARQSATRDDDVDYHSIDLWGEAETPITDRLRLILGLRGSYYRGSVDSILPANTGRADDALLQPKASLAWQAVRGVELYASVGRGFHSNDIRGAVTTVDPATGDAAVPVPVLVAAEGGEIGVRFEPDPRVRTAVTAFLLDLDSELIFVGDAGTSEPNAASRRYGVEATAFWDAARWLTLDVQAAVTRSRFRLAEGEPDHIPQSIPFMLAGGAVFDLPADVGLSLRLRHFSGTPLLEDNSVRSNATTLVNGQVTWRRGPVTASLGLFNILGAKDSDISFFFESRLPGESAPVEDIHFKPVEPRQLRFTLGFDF